MIFLKFLKCTSTKRSISYFLEKNAMATIIIFQCYHNAAHIRWRRLILLRVLMCNFIPSTFTRQFSADTMTDREEFIFSFAVSSV